MKSVRQRPHPRLNLNHDKWSSRTDHSSAPASLRLCLRPHAFLNQLLHLNQPRLIVRSHALTLYQETEFGVFFRDANTSRPWLADPVSGLSIDPEKISGIFLLHQTGAPSSFEICTHSSGFALAIQPTNAADLSSVKRIADSFGEARIESTDLIKAGAGAWLDDQMPHSPELEATPSGQKPLSFDLASGHVQVCASGPGYRISDSFIPGYVDRDENSFRIADQTHRRVVFATTDLFKSNEERRTNPLGIDGEK